MKGNYICILEKWQMLRFLVIGSGATLVHIIIGMLLLFICKNSIPIFLINFIAFVFAFLFSYFGHKYFTFKADGNLIKFLCVAILGFVFNSLLLYLELKAGVNRKIALPISIAVIPVVTYFLSKIWVFNKDYCNVQ